MKLAIEHIQQSIAVTERKLSDARELQKLHQKQADEQGALVAHCLNTIAELRAAMGLLRSQALNEAPSTARPSNPNPTEVPPAPVVDQIAKTGSAPRAVLSRKGN
jgi:hypothetical protein